MGQYVGLDVSLEETKVTEMWTQINVFHNRLQELTPWNVMAHNLPRLCAMVKEACQTHTGITEGTFYRDQGWFTISWASASSAPTRPPACWTSSIIPCCPPSKRLVHPWMSASGTPCCVRPRGIMPSAAFVPAA
jgi:hypothetical protein